MGLSDQYDVIVCGSGLAGLAAALSSAEAGGRTLLIEKGPRLGGTTLLSSGTIWTWSAFDELQAAIPDGNPILQRLVFDTIDEGRAWLARQGAHLGPETVVQGHGRGSHTSTPQIIEVLAQRFAAQDGQVAINTSLDGLVVEEGSVHGVHALAEGRPTTIKTSAVVLATGGFQGNPELVARYIVSSSDNLYLRANPWSTGDGFLAALSIGAAATPGMETFYGHAMLAPPTAFDQDHFGEVCQYFGKMSVAINEAGLRFADESEGTGEEVLNQRLARQPNGRGYYVVDAAIAAMPYTGDRLNQVIIDRARRYGAPMVEAQTLEDLAAGLARLGVPEPAVLRTLTEFNDAIVSGSAGDLHPPRRARRFPITTPPFTAVGVKASITATMGGLAVDERMRVLSRAGSSSPMAQSITNMDEYRTVPIPGLYAAGVDVGNLSHLGYMGMLGGCLVTGRIAGHEAARRSPARARSAD